ncbi:unnamed protein product [Gadus morhua 'NCC']
MTLTKGRCVIPGRLPAGRGNAPTVEQKGAHGESVGLSWPGEGTGEPEAEGGVWVGGGGGYLSKGYIDATPTEVKILRGDSSVGDSSTALTSLKHGGTTVNHSLNNGNNNNNNLFSPSPPGLRRRVTGAMLREPLQAALSGCVSSRAGVKLPCLLTMQEKEKGKGREAKKETLSPVPK